MHLGAFAVFLQNRYQAREEVVPRARGRTQRQNINIRIGAANTQAVAAEGDQRHARTRPAIARVLLLAFAAAFAPRRNTRSAIAVVVVTIAAIVIIIDIAVVASKRCAGNCRPSSKELLEVNYSPAASIVVGCVVATIAVQRLFEFQYRSLHR